MQRKAYMLNAECEILSKSLQIKTLYEELFQQTRKGGDEEFSSKEMYL